MNQTMKPMILTNSLGVLHLSSEYTSKYSSRQTW